MNIDPEHILSSPFTIGGFGSLVALKFAPGVTWLERCTNVLCGMLVAGYGAPALTEWLQFKSGGLVNAAAFVIGLLGMSLIAAVMQAIRDMRVKDYIDRWLPPPRS